MPNADKYLCLSVGFQLSKCVKDALVSLQRVWLEKETQLCVGVMRQWKPWHRDPILYALLPLFPYFLLLFVCEWAHREPAQCYGFELSSLCLPPLSLYLSTGFSLRAGRCPGGIWLHRCGVSVKEEGCACFKPPCENTSFPYTWQLDTLHITDLLSDTECVTLCCVL